MSTQPKPSSETSKTLFNCTTCGKSFRNLRILNAHLVHTHNIDVPQIEPVVTKKATSYHFIPVTKKAPKKERPSDSEPEGSGATIYIFKCPQCRVKYSKYVMMYRHIQAKHCVDIYGNTVDKDSPHLIKPIKLEICGECNIEIDEQHVCKTRSIDYGELRKHNKEIHKYNKVQPQHEYYCGCKQGFLTQDLFDDHIPLNHAAHVDSLFFKEFNYFPWWMSDLCRDSGARYLHKRTSTDGKYQYWNCSYMDPATKMRCPSAIFVQFLECGVQVNFYKTHLGHPYNDYSVKANFQCFNLEAVRQFTAHPQRNYGGGGGGGREAALRAQVAGLLGHAAARAKYADLKHLRLIYGKALDIITTINDQTHPVKDTPFELIKNSNIMIEPTASGADTAQANVQRRPIAAMIGQRVAPADDPDVIETPNKKRRTRPPSPKSSRNDETGHGSDTESADSGPKDPTVKIGKVFSLNKKAIEREKKIIKEVDIEAVLLNEMATKKPPNGSELNSSPKVPITESPKPPGAAAAAAVRSPASSYVDTFKDFIEKNHTALMYQPPPALSFSEKDVSKANAPLTNVKRNYTKKVHGKPCNNMKKDIQNKTQQELRPNLPSNSVQNVITKEVMDTTPTAQTIEIKRELEIDENITIEENSIAVNLEKYEVLEQENDCNILVFKM